jgi:hypothetical protein
MSLIREIDIESSLRKLKKLRKILKKTPQSFWSGESSKYVKDEMDFLEKLIIDKQTQHFFKAILKNQYPKKQRKLK